MKGLISDFILLTISVWERVSKIVKDLTTHRRTWDDQDVDFGPTYDGPSNISRKQCEKDGES